LVGFIPQSPFPHYKAHHYRVSINDDVVGEHSTCFIDLCVIQASCHSAYSW
jgi:hypothetical protein